MYNTKIRSYLTIIFLMELLNYNKNDKIIFKSQLFFIYRNICILRRNFNFYNFEGIF